jgi:prophage antirepressor-like protein
MEKGVQIFRNPQFGEIRTAGTAENPMFCLADVCKAIGITNSRNVKSRLDDEDVRLVDTPTNGGTQQLVFVSESGLYETIIRSDSESAKPFRKWVTGEVLPAIRKTGGYIAATGDMTDEEIMAKALLVAQSTIKRRDQRIRQLESDVKERDTMLLDANTQITEMAGVIETMQPKANYYDTILNNKSTVLITQIAQDYGMSAKRMNKILSEMGIQRKVNGQWILYSRYLGLGLVQSKPITIERHCGLDVKYSTEWTQKGRLFLYNELKEAGILPLIEK